MALLLAVVRIEVGARDLVGEGDTEGRRGT